MHCANFSQELLAGKLVCQVLDDPAALIELPMQATIVERVAQKLKLMLWPGVFTD